MNEDFLHSRQKEWTVEPWTISRTSQPGRQIKILSKKCHRKNPNLKPPKQTTEENYVTIFKNAPKAVHILNLFTGTFIHAFEEKNKYIV